MSVLSLAVEVDYDGAVGVAAQVDLGPGFFGMFRLPGGCSDYT